MDILPYKTQLKEFLSLSLGRCMQAVDARSGSIFLLDDNKEELILEVSNNRFNGSLEGIRTRVGDRIAGRVAEIRKPLLIEDIDNELSFAFTPRYNHYDTKSFLCVPLEFSGTLIGVVNVADKRSGISFDDNDLRVVLDICNYVGIALYSLKNYLEKQRMMIEELSQELARLKKSFEQSKKFSSLGKLVGGLVHEINNPLDGVIRYVNLAFKCQDEDSVPKEYLGQAKRGLGRIAQVVRSLLDFSWSLSHEDGHIDVNRAIDESLFMLSHYIGRHNVEIKKYLDQDLPKLPDYRLKIVFNNIIKNACEAMKTGGVLTICTCVHEGNVEVVFKDTGPGISAELQEKIFEPFFTTKGMGEGSGLGLAISYEIIQRYKGAISIKSGLGEGTLFRILLPISP